MKAKQLNALNVPEDAEVSETAAVLLMAEEPFELLVESVTEYAIFMLDPTGVVVTWNLGAERIKGYRAEEIIGEHFSRFYQEQDVAAGLPQRELEVAAREGRCEDEGWRVRKDGGLLWASVVITALRARDGRLVGFGKVTRDLTERRAAEEALQLLNRQQTLIAGELAAANSHLKNIFDASHTTSIISTDAQGMITVFNRGAQQILGYTEEEIVGRCTLAIFHLPEEIAARGLALSKLLGRTVEGFEVFTGSIGIAGFEHTEWTYVCKGGERLTVELSVSAVRGAAGEIVGYLGVAEDVTEKRRASMQLQSAYEQLNAVLESTSDSVMTIGHDWTIFYGNKKTLDSLPDFKVGRNYWECFPTVMATPVENMLRQAMSERVVIRYDNYFAPYAAWYRVNVFPTVEGLSIFFTDITDEKKLQEQLQMEQVLREKRIEALSHMAGGLAHEISNPLAIIHARASDLLRETEQPQPLAAAEVRDACGSIVKTSDRAMRILKGLQGFGREAAKDPMEEVSVYELVEECVELQESRFERHHVTLKMDLAEEMAPLLCRATQVGQIITNLLNNAFDAITQSHAQERWIALSAACEDGYLRVDVTDSGPAIGDHLKAHLMQPFFTTKEFGLGTGVGLSLSRAIAQDHGGTLVFCDENPHTCFRLLLPLRPEMQYRGVDSAGDGSSDDTE